MKYTMDYKNFDPLTRLALLRAANLDGFDLDENSNIVDEYDRDMETQISTGQAVVWRFVISPNSPVDFSKLSATLGIMVLTVHHEFWKKKFAGVL